MTHMELAAKLVPGLPDTLAQFETKVEGQFHCMEGPPHAYFEIPSPDNSGFYRYIYEVLAVKAEGRLEEHGKELIQALWGHLEEARKKFEADSAPLLFWRRHAALEEARRSDTGAWLCWVSVRLCVPGYSFGGIHSTCEALR